MAKKGQKIWAGASPHPPFSGNARKKNFFSEGVPLLQQIYSFKGKVAAGTYLYSVTLYDTVCLNLNQLTCPICLLLVYSRFVLG